LKLNPTFDQGALRENGNRSSKLKAAHLMALSALMLASCQTPKTLGPSSNMPGVHSSLFAHVEKTPLANSIDLVSSTQLSWEGRVLIEVDSTPPNKLSAPFALEISGGNGALRLLGPLGSTSALLSWGSNWATLESSQLKPQEQHFSSLSELMQHWLGSPIELEEILPGLLGQEHVHAGWRFEDNQGRIKVAQRQFPPPAVNIKLILDESPPGL
jgi:outer membrane biogenesis lipoprotein LolB